MGLEKVALSKLLCVLALLIHAAIPIVKSQILGCSIQDVDMGPCLNQSDGSFSIDHKCCKELNKVVQIGYSCLCLLAAKSFPLLSPPFLPLSNCSIFMPPLTLCRVIAPLPVVLPPSSPHEIIQPPMAPKDAQPVSPPPNERDIHGLNITRDDNLTMAEARPPSSEDLVPRLYLPSKQNGTCNGRSRSDKTKAMLLRSLFLFLALQGYVGLT